MKKTYFYAGVAIFCWSTVATTCKLLLNELNSYQVLWMNALIAAVFLIVLNLCTGNFKKFKDYTIKDYLIMALIGIPGTFFTTYSTIRAQTLCRHHRRLSLIICGRL